MAGIEQVKDFYNNYAAYEDGMSKMLRELKGSRSMLQDTQANPTANFYDDGVEGSKEYQAFAKALSDTIKKMEDKNTDPLEVKRSFKNLLDASTKYHESKNSLVILASKKEGQERYIISEKMMKILPNMVNIYDNLRKPFENDMAKDGGSYRNKSMTEVAARADKLVTKHADELADEDDWKKKPDFKDVAKTSKIQLSFMKKIKGISKTLGTTYNPTRDFDFYLTAKKKMTIEDKAKYFLGKKYIDKMFAPGINSVDAKNLADGFKAANFKKEYISLSKNPYFIQCLNDNPKDGLSKWNELEMKTDMTIRALKAEHEEMGLERLAPGIINQNIGTSSGPFGKPSPERTRLRQDEIISKMAEAMTLDMLTDPKMRNLAREIAMNPENRERLTENIKAHLHEQNIFASGQVYKVTNRASELMTDFETRKGIAQNFLRNVNAERQAEKQVAANAAKNAAKNAGKNDAAKNVMQRGI